MRPATTYVEAALREQGEHSIRVKPERDYAATGRYDAGALRQSKRKGREKGCWVYIPAAELNKVGIDPEASAPAYRLWGGERGRLVVTLYREP